MGLLGDDQAGEEVRALMVGTAGLVDAHVASTSRPTICKTRFIAGHQQLVRVDEESPHELEPAEEAALIAALERHLGDCDAVILSDYAKGTLGPKIIATAMGGGRGLGIPVYVDPKSTDFTRCRGATCIAPNLKELAAAAHMPVTSDAEIIAAATKVMQAAGAEAILATRSEKGMALVEASGGVHLEPARAHEVFDVSGAGDTVMAGFSPPPPRGVFPPHTEPPPQNAPRVPGAKARPPPAELGHIMVRLW